MGCDVLVNNMSNPPSGRNKGVGHPINALGLSNVILDELLEEIGRGWGAYYQCDIASCELVFCIEIARVCVCKFDASLVESGCSRKKSLSAYCYLVRCISIAFGHCSSKGADMPNINEITEGLNAYRALIPLITNLYSCENLRDAPMLLEQVIWKSKSCNTLAKIMIIAPTT